MVPLIGPHLFALKFPAYFEAELSGTHCICTSTVWLYIYWRSFHKTWRGTSNYMCNRLTFVTYILRFDTLNLYVLTGAVWLTWSSCAILWKLSTLHAVSSASDWIPIWWISWSEMTIVIWWNLTPIFINFFFYSCTSVHYFWGPRELLEPKSTHLTIEKQASPIYTTSMKDSL